MRNPKQKINVFDYYAIFKFSYYDVRKGLTRVCNAKIYIKVENNNFDVPKLLIQALKDYEELIEKQKNLSTKRAMRNFFKVDVNDNLPF